ncbi:deoxyhypusine synthase [Trypanosoma rangeli SC58]|uniref:Deoxyhypusine synthase n=1 Tax=Trypanosoma rangeli SC58 TaxID=429131 RepID=A0A061J374_TRYRA|nr:deoxyhypusine synthase [Trypanosoma rangeli SC58]
MADLALNAVFVRSSNDNFQPDASRVVRGPAGEQLCSLSASLQKYETLGFQASHFAHAVAICKKMLQPQPPSVPMGQLTEADGAAEEEEALLSPPLVQPTIFLGATANLFGTGCREAIRFLCAECVPLPDGVLPAVKSDEIPTTGPGNDDGAMPLYPPRLSKALIHALVVSGGAMEHDIRRACEPYYIAKHGGSDAAQSLQQQQAAATASEAGSRFGNISYGGDGRGQDSSMFSSVMRRLVSRLTEEQKRYKAASTAKSAPAAYDNVCTWSFGPSAVWYLAGLWLPELFTEVLLERNMGEVGSVADEAQRRAESTVLYWAAKNGVSIFSPSFVDGDVMKFVLAMEKSTSAMLKLDLVTDIYRLNTLAMRSQRSGMIILGGGVVKHHVCNANLMRNGADFTVFINNGQEFDGSDAGARPEEAISWGKIRLDGEYAKVYAEVSLVFPLLVAQAFVPWVRAARGLPQVEQGGEHA